jgi:hypothetical protein
LLAQAFALSSRPISRDVADNVGSNDFCQQCRKSPANTGFYDGRGDQITSLITTSNCPWLHQGSALDRLHHVDSFPTESARARRAHRE